jgi:serine/threonine protein kinase
MIESSSPLDDLSDEAVIRLEATCCRFEEAWQDGHPLRLEDALAGVNAAERPAFLRELLRLELYYRRQAGQTVSAQEYQERFPDATAVVSALFADTPQPETVDESHPYVPDAGQPTVDDVSAADPDAALAAHAAVETPSHRRARDRQTSGKLRMPTVAGYEILAKIAKGGMGVVYKARQRRLERLVALKMILSGDHATEAELIRFRTEGEAIARLHHPNIVQIHEVGEHDGLPFFSMEFCAGGSLEKKLAGTPLPPRDAASLVQTLAGAMQAAHEKSVIHRDLKPANVLLTEDGTPKITDFGLAKKLDETGLTAVGVVMGTPPYMAPEQARGQTVGPLADVYALGAILYEFLTGRPPFKGPTVLDTILLVLHVEPVSPRQLQPQLPRDLETICLKCIQKEPGRRYASARELADDLGRYLRGEPVRARPVGRLERGWRWCKRNKAVASLMTAVAASLLFGFALSTMFAIQANDNAEDEKRARQDADHQRKNAVAARNDLQDKVTELAQANDNLRTSVARTTLQSLAFRATDSLPPLSDREDQALWELASPADQPLRLRFIEEALRGPVLTRHFVDRSAFTLKAAVGLDSDKRARVEQLLGERLAGKDIAADQRRDIALTLVRSGVRNRALARDASLAIADALGKNTNPGGPQELTEALSALLARLEPGDAVSLFAALGDSLDKTADPSAVEQILPAVAARMEPRDVAEAAAAIARALAETTQPLRAQRMTKQLIVVAARLDSKGAAGPAATLTQSLANAPPPPTLGDLPVDGLLALAARLDPKDAAGPAATLARALAKETDYRKKRALVKGLSAIAARLEPKQGAAVLAQAVLYPMMSGPDQSDLARILSVVAFRLEPKDAAELCAPVAAALAQEVTNWRGNMNLKVWPVQSLSAVTACLEPSVAAVICAPAIASVKQDLESGNPAYTSALKGELLALEARQKRLPEATAEVSAQTAAGLVEALARATNPFVARLLAEGLSVSIARLEPKLAAGICAPAAATLARALAKTTNPAVQEQLAQGLSAVAARLDSQDAAKVCTPAADVLVRALAKANDPPTLQQLAQGLSAVAARLDSQDAAKICAPAAASLAKSLTKSTDPVAAQQLAEGLSALAARLEPKEGAKICSPAATVLAESLAKPTTASAQYHLALGLSAVASRLEPQDAARVCAPPAATLAQTLFQTLPNVRADPRDNWHVGQGLLALAAKLDAKGAAEPAALLAQTLAKETHPGRQMQLGQWLSEVAGRLEPKDAASICAPAAATLAGALSKATDPPWQEGLAQGVSALAVRMEPKEGAAVLAEALSKATDPRVREDLARVLSAVAARMETGAAANLAETLSKVINPNQQGDQWVQVVLAVVARMEPAKGIAVLTEARTKLTDPDRLQSLAVFD